MGTATKEELGQKLDHEVFTRMLTEALKARNMNVEAPSFLSGTSGVKHQFDVMVSATSG